jgi:hypothetical protein
LKKKEKKSHTKKKKKKKKKSKRNESKRTIASLRRSFNKFSQTATARIDHALVRKYLAILHHKSEVAILRRVDQDFEIEGKVGLGVFGHDVSAVRAARNARHLLAVQAENLLRKTLEVAIAVA